MKHATLEDDQKRVEFVARAVEAFKQNKQLATYADKVDAGEHLALRWGLFEDCVLVVRLADDFEPVNYGRLLEGRP